MNNKNGNRFTQKFKDAVLVRMMPPNRESIKNISDELGISNQYRKYDFYKTSYIRKKKNYFSMTDLFLYY